MGDYSDLIRLDAIALGDLAFSIGDYATAVDNYKEALEYLGYYHGDNQDFLMLEAGLVVRIEELEKSLDSRDRLLYPKSWTLSKTSFVKGRQCVKYLYLDRYKKSDRTPLSKETLRLFDKGHAFEERFREEFFPEGTNVKEDVRRFSYFKSYTDYLLQLSGRQVLFEAAIIEEEVLILCDVLVKEDNGDVEVYEVKMTTSLNDAILNDVALQYFICRKKFGDNLKKFNLVLPDESDASGFQIVDLAEELNSKIFPVAEQIAQLKDVLKRSEPDVMMGSQCHSPYRCEFVEYCTSRAQKQQ